MRRRGRKIVQRLVRQAQEAAILLVQLLGLVLRNRKQGLLRLTFCGNDAPPFRSAR